MPSNSDEPATSLDDGKVLFAKRRSSVAPSELFPVVSSLARDNNRATATSGSSVVSLARSTQTNPRPAALTSLNSSFALELKTRLPAVTFFFALSARGSGRSNTSASSSTATGATSRATSRLGFFAQPSTSSDVFTLR